jgi:undecaprenyl-phosphate galactose phosphotransferase
MDPHRSELELNQSHFLARSLIFSQQRVKRFIDVVVCSVMLLCAAPLFPILYAIITLDGGPCLFRHKRIGAGGREFDCLKFRTMVPDSDRALADLLARNASALREWSDTQKLTVDPRVTRVGRILRKTSLDELPQLINVLRNDMSLVGPRPITQSEVARYGASIGFYQSVQPGITGLWQVSGRSGKSYDLRVALDVEYAKTRSIRKDLWIMLKTVPSVLFCRGAC